MVQLFVRTLSGTTSCVETQLYDNVASLKHAIEVSSRVIQGFYFYFLFRSGNVECLTFLFNFQVQEGVPADLQGLVHAGKQLQDELSLQHYSISSGSTVHLVLRLRGGKGGFGALLRGQGRDGKVTTNFDAMRDLQGRRLRHQFSEQKLAEWKAQAKERELEKVALQHIKEMAKEQKRQERDNVGLTVYVHGPSWRFLAFYSGQLCSCLALFVHRWTQLLWWQHRRRRWRALLRQCKMQWQQEWWQDHL